MADMLVSPNELRRIANALIASSKKISVAIQAIDQNIVSLKGDKFLGNRTNVIQAHYAPKREALLKMKAISVHFAEDLQTTATFFEKADNGIS